MNAAAYEALRKIDAIHYVGPVSAPIIFREKVLSKLLRTFGSQGNFFAFSRERLEAIAGKVERQCLTEARVDFFHGFTPWILTRPPRPYVAWSDCTFHDYVDIYHRRGHFQSADLDRIEKTEAAWLRDARDVGFSNDWAAQRAVRHYRLDESRVHVVGNFGEVEMPAADEYAGAKQFVFVSTVFEAKGGPTVLAAFRKVRQRHADAALVIVGARPPGGAKEPGVTFAGYLRKEVPQEYALFRKTLAAASALVHPTDSDISPLIVIEAGYFGCPAIASNRFAIPELVDHGVSGILLDDVSANAVADAMSWMIEHESDYLSMRERTWLKARNENSKTAFERAMQAMVVAPDWR
jgi:glycosyltransferase involved in cell wall biosynthesis